MMKEFTGTVSSRSSKSAVGPPGERAILDLNPERRERILELTVWPSLYSGSLNLQVDDSVLDLLGQREPNWREDASHVLYPEGWKHIPVKRVAYLYYKGTARSRGMSVEVLVRRAQNPVPGRVELFAANSIREKLELSDGDAVLVELDNSDEVLDEMRKELSEERRFASNAGKEERERWVVGEFLRLLGVEFKESELVSLEQAHFIDVTFCTAQFQVKEIPTPGERRQQEINEAHRRVMRAKTLEETVGPGFVYDRPSPVAGDELVYEAAARCCEDPRYRRSKSETDLLFYVTHTGSTLSPTWSRDRSSWTTLGYRSISCLIKDQAVVLHAGDSAPEFLRQGATGTDTP